MEPRIKDYLNLAVWSVALFTFCFLLNTRHHRFPFFYHPDEPGKVGQLLTGNWNFHHPMLLLAVTDVATKAFGVPMNPQPVVEAGRMVSAGFMAAAVVGFSLLAYLWRGWPAAFTAGVVLGLHHQFYELGHYMKEDSALIMGISFTFLATLAYAQSSSWWRVLVLGASVGLAISGKYIGVAVLAVALPVVWVHSEGSRLSRLGLFLAGVILMVMAVNLPLVLHPGTFGHSLNREMEQVVEGQGDTTRRVPHALYWNVFIDNSTPLIWLFLLLFLGVWWSRRDGLSLAQRLIVAFPFVFALVLSFSPKEHDRYFLPATALFTFLACLGAMDVPRLVQWVLRAIGLRHPERAMSGVWRSRAIMVAALGLATLQITGWAVGKPGWLAYDLAFQRDDKAELIAWMQAKLPADAVVVADSATGLMDPGRKKNALRLQQLPQKIKVSKLAADLGSLEQLRAQGAYVVVSESSYGRFFRADLRAKEDKDKKFAADKAFYEYLLREEPLFERERGTVIYLHPGIRVYRLEESKDSGI